MAHLRLKDKWLSYLQCTLQSQTTREAAKSCTVHRSTSFRWRHCFLQWAKRDGSAHLGGITEANETDLLESSKGARKLGRAARKRGGPAAK